MKILHVIPSVSEVRGGPTESLRICTRELVVLGVEVHVATTDDDGPGGRLQPPPNAVERRDGVVVHYFARQSSFYSFSAPLLLWLWKNVRNYDLIHIHALFNFPAFAAGLVANLKNVPYIVRPLGTMSGWGFRNRRPFLKRLSFGLLEGPLLARAAAVHCTSEMERKECSRFRTVVIPNPVETGPRGGALPGAERTILFLGRLDPKKGLDLLLPAFASVLNARPDARLRLVGDGAPEFVAGLKSKVRELGLEASVSFSGFLKGDARREAWRTASVFVLTSRTENFGISVVEAMERGLPVVISDAVGICDEVAARDAGLVVPCEVPRIAAALLELLADADLRQRLGNNGRVAAQELYSPSSVARALLGLYQGICAGETPAGKRGGSHV